VQEEATVLHYVGYDVDRGGIIAVIRSLAAARRFRCLLGVGPRFTHRRTPLLDTLALPPLAGETIDLRNVWRARHVARQVRAWLSGDERRIFHGHSRAGLLVALWLHAAGERRLAATVHCLGRQRWFYRWAARRLGARLLWLTPSMRRHYGLAGDSWDGCIPGCIPEELVSAPAPGRRPRAGRGLVVAGVGALVAVKQWDLVLTALARLPAGGEVRFLHAGAADGTPASAATAAELHRLGERLGLAARVTWLGEIADVSAVYAQADVVVCASRWEAFSVAALEAAAAGAPLIVADSAGNADVVVAARLGWTFAADSAESLAGLLADLAGTDRLASWRQDRLALAQFGAERVAEQYAGFYQRVVFGR
jgi:glycosyltransferase involved in cell wall biosynthesis